MGRLCLWALSAVVLCAGVPLSHGAIIFDDFEAGEGHFATEPSAAGGSNRNLAGSSTADRIVGERVEPAGVAAERLVLEAQVTNRSTLLRFLSGGGSPGLNTPFTTSGSETDGFIGLAVKTSTPGWTVQLALDGPTAGDFQGGVERAITGDGQWHVYEWDLDHPASWGGVPELGGNGTFDDGVQTIDSIIFRHLTTPASSTLFMDFVAKSDAGTIAVLVPEPSGLFAVAAANLLATRIRRREKSRTERP